MILKLLKILLAVFFVFAGMNHFINPDFYFPLIPPYIPFHGFVNIISGIIEIVLGIGLLFPAFQKVSAWGIIILMILFIPSHVYFIQIGSCIEDGLCVPPWVGWLRLVVVHPLLILWAYLFTKSKDYGK